METTAGGRHRNKSNRPPPNNKLRVNELTDSLQAELHLSLERLSDSELDQDDLKRLKQQRNNNNKHYSKQHDDDDDVIDTQDSLEMIENKEPVRSARKLPRLLQRASEGGDILDSLDATDLRDVIEEEDEDTYRDDVINKEKSSLSTYDELMDDADPYADLRYNYEPNGVLKPVENFIDDVSNDESEYRYYDDGGSTLTGGAVIGGGKGETPEMESEPDAGAAAELLQAENDRLEEEYRKFFDQNKPNVVEKTPSSEQVSSRGGRSISARTVTVKQPQIYREQFERSAQRLRKQNNVSPGTVAAKPTSKASSVASKSPRVKQPPAQPIQVKNIIERNRARAGQKSSSASYLEIHSKKRNKKQQSIGSQRTASISTSNMDKVGDNLPPELLSIAKSETDLLHRRRNVGSSSDERETAEETWLKQQIKLKEMRKGGNPKKQRPPKQFLKIANEKSTVAVSPSANPTPPTVPPPPQRQVVVNNPQQFYHPQQFHYDFNNQYPLLPPQRVQPPYANVGYQQLPHNGNMTIDPYINGGYYYPPPPPPQQIPVYYQQQFDPSLAPLPPPPPSQKQPLPPIPRSSLPQNPTAEMSPPSGGSAVQSPTSTSPNTKKQQQRNSLPNYRKYTLDDYRNIKRDQGQLGGLGPDLSTAKTKSGKAARAKQYAESVRNQHKAVRPQAAPHPRVQAEEDAEAVKRKRQAARQRALSYAREVPKPKVAPPPSAPEPEAARKSRIPIPQTTGKATTARRQDSKLSQQASDHLKRRSSSTFTIDKSGTSPGSGGVDLDLIRALRERHEREKAMVAQIATSGK